MTRPAPLILLAATTLAATAACVPAPDQPTDPGAPAAPARTTATARPACTAAFPTRDHSGITIAHGTVIGTVTVTCTGTPHYPTYLVTFGHSADRSPDDVTYPGSTTFTSTHVSYRITAPCAPGDWVLDITVTATVDHTAIETVTNGTQITLGAPDCH
ncbi:MAG TPA: hypothetical protein VGX23_36970 [Actinocrinis sp.]|nr:hypothetical protein [Actinocrinis sp.]